MGFWNYPARGRGMHARQMLAELRAEQQSGKVAARPRAGFVDRQYPVDQFPGAAAWISGSWKLYRGVARKGASASYRLFNLDADLKEATDLSRAEPVRLKRMKAELADWQKSVVKSLNGGDYPPDTPE